MSFRPKQILKNQFIIPFGRFRLKRARPSDDSPVLVGREGQRAFFVDALTGIGERGAFLITGRRGVGKTTFVENCIDDYRQNVFRRFLGSGAGRSIYDFGLLVGFAFALIGVLLASGELLAYLVPELSNSPLLFIPLMVCTTIAGAPFILGLRIVRAAFSSFLDSGVIIGLFSFFILFCVALFTPPFGSPTIATSVLIVMISFLFFCGSFFYRRAPLTLGLIRKSETKDGLQAGHFVIPSEGALQLRLLTWDPLLPLALSISGTIGSAYFAGFFHAAPTNEVLYRFLGFGFALFLGTTMGHAWATREIIARKRNILENEVSLGPQLTKRTLLLVLFAFVLFCGIGGIAGALSWVYLIILCATVLFATLLVAGSRIRAFLGSKWGGEDRRPTKIFRIAGGPASLYWFVQSIFPPYKSNDGARFLVPPVHSLLLTKGFALMLMSAHLLFPLLIDVLETVTFYVPFGLGPASNSALFEVHLGGSVNQPSSSTLSLFNNSSELFWFLSTFCFVVLLFVIEYEWINRPFVDQRQPRALDRGPRKPQYVHHNLDPVWFEVSASRQFDDWDEANDESSAVKTLVDLYEPAEAAHRPPNRNSLFSRRNALQQRALRRFRTMEAATFTYAVTRLWLPVLEVNVNLGFDSLDHRGVTHAMLDGLRRTYRRTFVAFYSPYAILRNIGRIFIVMVLIVPLARIWFDYSNVEPFSDDLKNFGNDSSSTANSFLACEYLSLAEIAHHQVNPDYKLLRPLVPRLICLAGNDWARPILRLLYSEIVPFSVSRNGDDGHVVLWFAHLNQAPPVMIKDRLVQPNPSLSVRVYHLLLAVALLTLLERVARRFPLMPYRRNLSRIEELIAELTLSRADTRHSRSGFSLGGLFGINSNHENGAGVETSRDALDPRAVELKLLALLNDLRTKPLGRAYGPWRRFTIPMPDIQFVFDELDKLSGVVDPELGVRVLAEQDQQALFSERSRAYQLHRLLSDMKRVISSAPARFIFVGGRALHDEWVRDQNRLGSSQPLLTSIFDHEIYLPSLLIDFSRARYDNALVGYNKLPNRALDLRIKEFLVNTYASSVSFEETLIESRHMPWVGLPRMANTAMLYADHIARLRERYADFDLIDSRMGNVMRRRNTKRKAFDADWIELEPLEQLQVIWREEFFSTFVGFLAYRSAGSPKKLNELLSEMVRPSGSLLDPQIEKDALVPTSRDALVIDEKLLYRVQFINSLFRHIETSFGVDLLQRDDKISINTIFIFDFLMKMHSRAFSWSSIERLDELAHIHRAPDLRRLFDAILSNSAERYFHRVLNGLFAFRFRSELAIEIKYLSRISQAEMAALNFTLDESYELKMKFTEMLESSGKKNADLMTALGELYEFDQAYDLSRDYYERALHSIDQEFERLNGVLLSSDDKLQQALESVLQSNVWSSFVPGTMLIDAKDLIRSERPNRPPTPFMHGILLQSEAAKDAIRLNLPWAIRRLRLMLQVGLTYEQQADEERAQAQYHSAFLFGSMILKTALDRRDTDPAPLSHVVKHLPLIFQPVFASAWVAEKLENGVDTSLSIVERELIMLRATLPFVQDVAATETAQMETLRDGGIKRARDARSNHLLVMAELHNKAGDLHFFKGRAAYDISDGGFPKLVANDPNGRRSGTEGYLFRAHYNYALALHEVRRFVFYRANISTRRLNIKMSETIAQSPERGDWKTLDEKNIPTFVLQTAYSSITDLAEVTLARSSMMEAWLELDEEEATVGANFGRIFTIENAVVADHKTTCNASGNQKYSRELFASVRQEIDQWFHLSDKHTRPPTEEQCQTAGAKKAIRDFFGAWATGATSTEQNRIFFGMVSPNHERILIALMISIYGSRAVNRANYPDAASFESQITAEHIVRLLRSARSILAVAGSTKPGVPKEMAGRLQKCRSCYELGTKQLDFLTVLIEIGAFSINRLIGLKELAYPDDVAASKIHVDASKYRPDFQTTDTSEIVAATLASELRLLIADLTIQATEKVEVDQLQPYLQHWAANMNFLRSETDKLLSKDVLDVVHAYQQHFSLTFLRPLEGHRRHARATLIYLVTHHKYPILTNLTALKALIDDAFVIDGLAAGEDEEAQQRLKEAEVWLNELINAERLVDAPMHFPPSYLADTLSLHALVRHNEKSIANQARKYRWRAEQSFTMGRQYYQNISRLIYLFDDFNDRRRHSVQAGQMGIADILALYRYVLDDREI